MALTIYFDFDGPIIDVSVRYHRLHSDLTSQMGFRTLPFDTYWEMKRQRMPIDRILPNCTEAERRAYTAKRLDLIETSEYLAYDRIHPWAKEVLTLMGRDHRLILVTLRNSRKGLIQQIERLGIKGHFEQVLSKDNNHGDWRVKRELILSYPPIQCPAVMVGDTEGDILAGRDLRFYTVGVLSGIRTREYLESLGADRIILDIRSLPDILQVEVSCPETQAGECLTRKN